MMKTRTFGMIVAMAVSVGGAVAQTPAGTQQWKPFKNFDVGITMGSTGIGIEAAMPVAENVKVRTGLDFMPRFDYPMHFTIQSFDKNGRLRSEKENKSRIERLSNLMHELTGFEVDGTVKMIGTPRMWNYKLLVDVYPFRNKNWHLTGGFYLGQSKIADAINSVEDASSLFAVGIYNHLYENEMRNYNGEATPLVTYGELDEDGNPEYALYLDPYIGEKIRNFGRVGIHLGDYKDRFVEDDEGNPILDDEGNKIPLPYRMEPDKDNTVSAKVTVNRFKPYLGFGYGGKLFRDDDRYRVSMDCGLLFWGGTPSIITHDGTNLSKNVDNILGSVGTYVDVISFFKVYPVINLRLTRNF